MRVAHPSRRWPAIPISLHASPGHTEGGFKSEGNIGPELPQHVSSDHSICFTKSRKRQTRRSRLHQTPQDDDFSSTALKHGRRERRTHPVAARKNQRHLLRKQLRRAPGHLRTRRLIPPQPGSHDLHEETQDPATRLDTPEMLSPRRGPAEHPTGADFHPTRKPSRGNPAGETQRRRRHQHHMPTLTTRRTNIDLVFRPRLETQRLPTIVASGEEDGRHGPFHHLAPRVQHLRPDSQCLQPPRPIQSLDVLPRIPRWKMQSLQRLREFQCLEGVREAVPEVEAPQAGRERRPFQRLAEAVAEV